MKHLTTLLSIAFLIGLQATAAVESDSAVSRRHCNPQPARFAVFSDPHFYSPSLGTTGAAFEAYLAEDRKMLRESTAIVDSAIDSVLAAKVDFVIVPGDLTKDGELVNHVGFARQLARLERAGIKTFVVPGNHDINNPHAVAFEGDATRPVRTVSPREFAMIYCRSGYGEALDRDRHSLSYVAEPARGLWLLAIDSADYDENKVLGVPVTGGRLKPETKAWVLRKLAQARARGKQVIAFMHHGLVEHFAGQSVLFADYLVDDRKALAEAFGNAGLKTVFTGHFHAQDVATMTWQVGTETRSITDVETGSLVTAPSPYRIVTVARDGALSIASHRVESIDFDLGGIPFPDYADAFLFNGLDGLVRHQLAAQFGLTPEQVNLIAPPLAAGFAAHYAGDETPSPEVLYLIGALKLNPASAQLGFYLESIWTDLTPADNDLALAP